MQFCKIFCHRRLVIEIETDMNKISINFETPKIANNSYGFYFNMKV